MCQFEDVPMRKVTLICPKCKADLMESEVINQVRTGVQTNTLSFNRERNWFDAKEIEFESDGIFEEHHCAKCNADISEIIKNYI